MTTVGLCAGDPRGWRAFAIGALAAVACYLRYASAPVVGATAAVSLTATGDLVAAQGAGVAIRLLAAIVSATTAVTISLRNGAADVIPIRLATNGVAVLPFVAGGWMTTDANTALRVAFAGLSTVTVYALWSEG